MKTKLMDCLLIKYATLILKLIFILRYINIWWVPYNGYFIEMVNSIYLRLLFFFNTDRFKIF